MYNLRLLEEKNTQLASYIHLEHTTTTTRTRQAQPDVGAVCLSNGREKRQRKVSAKDDIFSKMEHSLTSESRQKQTLVSQLGNQSEL